MTSCWAPCAAPSLGGKVHPRQEDGPDDFVLARVVEVHAELVIREMICDGVCTGNVTLENRLNQTGRRSSSRRNT
jgi:hypothetical protein